MATNNKPSVKKKSNAGRPTKMDPAIVNKLVAAFSNGFNDTQACQYAGISRQTLYNWTNKDQQFLDKITMAQENPSMVAREVIMDTIRTRRSWMAAAWWLERKNKDEFSNRSELTGRDGKDLLEGISNEQLSRILNIGKQAAADIARDVSGGATSSSDQKPTK